VSLSLPESPGILAAPSGSPMSTPVRLAYFVSHPIQYQAPLLRYIVRNSDIDLTALFMNDHSLREYRDVGFGAAVKWDVPLIEGYKSELIPALGGRDSVEGLKPYNFGILQALKRGGYDAIWLHGYAHPSNLRAIWAAKFLGMKVLVRGEPNLLVARRSAGTAGLKDKAVQWLFRQIDGFLAIGSMNREYYLHHGVPEEKIFMVPYTVDNEFFQAKAEEAAPNRESLRAELGLAPGRPVVLYASKFTARKKADVLLEAYARLSPDGVQEPAPYLVFVGDGELAPALKARAAELGWDSVRFLGFKNQTELPALFNLCDVFVLASAKEPYGLIVNEVMASGRPCIVSDEVCSGADLIEHGLNGFIVKVDDVDGLAGALKEATSDLERARRMGEAAQARMQTWGFREDLAGLEAALAHVLR
jgi:glycosyltransferase involved in cell wall biosynthesis